MACINNFSFPDLYQVENPFSHYKKIYKKILLIEKKGENKFNSITVFENGEEFKCQTLNRISLNVENIGIPYINQTYTITSRYTWDNLEIRITGKYLEYFINNSHRARDFSLLRISEDGTIIERWNINGCLCSVSVNEADYFDLNFRINHATLHC